MAVVLVLFASVPVVGAVWQFTINVPADVAYQNKFGAYVALAVTGPPDFNGIQTNVNIFYHHMNATWAASEWNSTYNSAFPWDRTADNSLWAENQYLQHLNARIAYYKAEINKTGATQYTDIYNSYITNLRAEIQQTGNLDWVVHGAWLLQNAPLTYWFGVYMIVYSVLITIVAAVLLIIRNNIEVPYYY